MCDFDYTPLLDAERSCVRDSCSYSVTPLLLFHLVGLGYCTTMSCRRYFRMIVVKANVYYLALPAPIPINESIQQGGTNGVRSLNNSAT